MQGAGVKIRQDHYGEDIQLQRVNAFCRGVEKEFRKKIQLADFNGRPCAEVSLSPSIYVHDIAVTLRHAEALSLDVIHAAMQRAATVFQHDTIAGLSPTDYVTLVRAVTGLPAAVIENSLTSIADVLRNMAAILANSVARGARFDVMDALAVDGCSLASRKGDLLTVLAAGNGPGVHSIWPQAIGMGYRVIVRPSQREPFTAQRLVLSLSIAGLQNYIALIPTDHNVSEELINVSDLAIVYGGDEVVRKFQNRRSVLVQGPGRSKIVIGNDTDMDEAVALVAKSVTSLGGAACVSTSTVLVENDHRLFAERLYHYFNNMPDASSLPVCTPGNEPLVRAVLEQQVISKQSQADINAGQPIFPIINIVDTSSSPSIHQEYPFPYVTVAPYDPALSDQQLSGSLVVTALTQSPAIIQAIINNPTISNVYLGNVCTTWMNPLVPHDGYLADFLMRNRGIKVANGLKTVT